MTAAEPVAIRNHPLERARQARVQRLERGILLRHRLPNVPGVERDPVEREPVFQVEHTADAVDGVAGVAVLF